MSEQDTTEGTEEKAPEASPYQEKYEKLRPLERYVEALGSVDELIDRAGLGHQIKNNPAMLEAVQRIARGEPVAPAPKVEEEEKYYDPEVKSLRGELSPVVEQLQQQLADANARLAQTETRSLRSALSGNIESTLAAYKDEPELMKEAQEEILRAVKQSERAAEQGDRAALAQLNMLATEGGAKTMEMLTLDTYKKLVEKKLSATKDPGSPDDLLKKATDARHTARSSLPSDVVQVRPGKVNARLTQEVMEQVAAKLGRDPKTLFN